MKFRKESPKPSILLLVVLSLLFIFLLALTKITSYDVWFHLATGRHILEAGFTDTDPFSYTQPGSPMYLQSWLTGLLFYLTWSTWTGKGLEALTLLKAIIAVTIFGILWINVLLRDSKHRLVGLVTAVVLVVGAYGLKIRLHIRPQLIEYLLLAGSLLVLSRYRWRILPTVPALAAIQLLWVNSHSSFILGLALPVLFLSSDCIDALKKRPEGLRHALGVAGLTLAVLFLVTALNPVGFRVLETPFNQLNWAVQKRTVGELQNLKLVHLVGFGMKYTWGYSVLAMLGVVALAVSIFRGRRPPVWEPITFGIFCVLPFLVGIRFIAEFVVVACPIVIGWWLALLPSPTEKSSVWPIAEIAFGIVLIPLWWVTIAQNPIYSVGIGEKPDKYPAKAVSFLEKTHPSGPMFNSLGFGGYLIWHLPDSKVFIDGRLPLYGSEFYSLYRRAHTDPDIWKHVEQTFGPTVVILEYLTDYARKERMPHLENNPAWALVFWDPVAKIYLKRVSANADLIARYEYHWAKPAYSGLSHLMNAMKVPEDSRKVRREFLRAVSENSRNAEAYLGLAFIDSFGAEPNFDEGIKAARRAIELKPEMAKAHAVACRALLGLGEQKLAREACSRAVSLNPRDVLARWANQSLGNPPAGRRGHP
jgi:hypothetical protein